MLKNTKLLDREEKVRDVQGAFILSKKNMNEGAFLIKSLYL